MRKAQSIADEVRRRIVELKWREGERIPDEADLAVEFSAARATVNKALQVLADEGLLDRRRRAGTRVVVNPVRKATFSIPIVREQVEDAGLIYSHRVVAQRLSPIPATSRYAWVFRKGNVWSISGRCITPTANPTSSKTAGLIRTLCQDLNTPASGI